jgi:hypothetical protein
VTNTLWPPSPMPSMEINFMADVQMDPAKTDRKSYRVGLFADGLDTGIWYDGLTKRAAMKQADLMIAEAPALLLYYGVHHEVYERCHAARAYKATGLHTGDVIRLARPSAGMPAGQLCRVERLDLDSSGAGLDTLFPVVVSPLTPDGAVGALQIPLELADIDAASRPLS